MRATTPNARFWAWTDGGWCKITLRPGQTLSTHCGGLTDEGWSSYSETWTHSGDHVKRNSTSEGRDCDGCHSSYGEDVCQLDQLAAWEADDGTMAPRWVLADSANHDEYAEAAGY